MRGPVLGRPRDDPGDEEDAHGNDRSGGTAPHADGVDHVVRELVLAFEIVLHQLGGGTGVQLLPGCRNRVRVRISKNMVSRSRVRGGVKGRVGRWQARQGRGWVEMREAYIRIRLSYLTH